MRPAYTSYPQIYKTPDRYLRHAHGNRTHGEFIYGNSVRMTQTLSANVAQTIRMEIARQRIPQTRLAEALQLSQATVSRRLSGVAAFELDELPVVAQLLDVRVSDLIKDAA